MPTIHQILEWFASGQHRLIAAAILFALMWLLKLLPGVEEKLLTTPQRRLAAVVFMALAPAVSLLATGAPVVDVLESALVIGFAAMGIHAGSKVAGGGTIGATEKDPPP